MFVCLLHIFVFTHKIFPCQLQCLRFRLDIEFVSLLRVLVPTFDPKGLVTI